MVLVIFRRFLNFGPFFGPFLGTVVESSKQKRFAPGNSLNFAQKNPTNPFFQNVHFLGLIMDCLVILSIYERYRQMTHINGQIALIFKF